MFLVFKLKRHLSTTTTTTSSSTKHRSTVSQQSAVSSQQSAVSSQSVLHTLSQPYRRGQGEAYCKMLSLMQKNGDVDLYFECINIFLELHLLLCINDVLYFLFMVNRIHMYGLYILPCCI